MGSPVEIARGDAETQRERALVLADRAARADGPDRKLDAEIWCLVNGHRIIRFEIRGPLVAQHLIYDPADPRCGPAALDLTQGWLFDGVPYYTSIIHHATRLLPNGWYFSVGIGPKGPFARLDRIGSGAGPKRFQVTANRPALALTAASLRALATSIETDA